jgi:ribA/ribD-fused uncharacterized protein
MLRRGFERDAAIESFVFFWSGPFSQWHPSPFVIDSITYNCAEQYMMAEKARLFGDTEREAMIMAAADPGDQKRYGRMVEGFDNEVWLPAAKAIVKRASYAKFEQNADLRVALFATGKRTLVEASPHDKLWGIGLRESDPRAMHRSRWQGKNWLGEVLTEVRNEMQPG